MKNFGCYLVSLIVNYDLQKNYYIFSDPRGGSTWMAELISLLPKTTMVWEPLHLEHSSTFQNLKFSWRQYIPENEKWIEAQEAFTRIFKGKELNSQFCRNATVLSFLVSNKLIVKFVRANALLPWLTNEFNFKYDPIFLIRHPFSVVASQLKSESWGYEFTGFQIPDCPYNEHYRIHEKFLSSLKTKEEALVASWCLTNKIPLRSKHNNKKWITIYYENLLQYPDREMKKIFERWNIDMPADLMNNIKNASSTTLEATFQKNIEHQLYKWKSFFNDEQLRNMQKVLEYFEISEYDSSDVLPRNHIDYNNDK